MKYIESIDMYTGNFLNYQILKYETSDGKVLNYERVTRNKNSQDNQVTNAVGMIIFNQYKSKILLQKEFRPACNNWVYNFPGGLIDEGESIEQAATRELKEETGLSLISIVDYLPPSYTAVGLSDEMVGTIIGIATGDFQESSSANEEIEAKWYTKEEIKELLKHEFMSLRTQSVLYMWANQ